MLDFNSWYKQDSLILQMTGGLTSGCRVVYNQQNVEHEIMLPLFIQVNCYQPKSLYVPAYKSNPQMFFIHHLSSSNHLRSHLQHDWWMFSNCSGCTSPTSVASTWGQSARMASSVLMRVTDHRECHVCCDEWTDGANKRKRSEQLLCPFAAGGGWRRARSCQTSGSDVRAGRRCRWPGSCPSLASGEVCTVALDTAVAKTGKQNSRNVASHILRWHLVTIGHTYTLLESTSIRHTSVTHCFTWQCPLLRDGMVSACWISTAVREAQATSSQH